MRHRQAKHFYPGRTRRASRIGIHITDTSPTTSTAWGVAGYFTHTDVRASAHETDDDRETVSSVLLRDTAFGISGLNSPTIHREHVAKLVDVERWAADPWASPTLMRSAARTAELCVQFGIAPVRLTGPAIFDYTRTGLVAHSDADRQRGDRTPHGDPGPYWPWAWYLGRVRELMGHQPATEEETMTPDEKIAASRPHDEVTAAFRFRGGTVQVQWDGGTRFIDPPHGRGWDGGTPWPFPGPYSVPGLDEDQRRIPHGFIAGVVNDRGGFDLIHRLGATFNFPT